MQEEIKNRVSESKLITFDLEDFYPEGNRIELDISQFLFEGMLLKEKADKVGAKVYVHFKGRNPEITQKEFIDSIMIEK